MNKAPQISRREVLRYLIYSAALLAGCTPVLPAKSITPTAPENSMPTRTPMATSPTDFIPESIAEDVHSPSPVVAIASGSRIALALIEDGQVYAWGNTYDLNLSEETSEAINRPQLLAGIEGVAAASTAESAMLLVDSQGHIRRLYRPENHLFRRIGDIDGVVRASESGATYVALREDHSLWVLTRTRSDGVHYDPIENNSFMRAGIDDVVDYDQIGSFIAAARSDGTVWYWGLPPAYFDPDQQYIDVPTRLNGLEGITAVSFGEGLTMLNEDGLIKVWWLNAQLQVDEIQGLPRIRNVDGHFGTLYSLAVGVDDSVWTWGFGWARAGTGEAGHDPIGPEQILPHLVPFESTVEVSADHAILALDRQGTVWGWGSNLYGLAGLDKAIRFADTPQPILSSGPRPSQSP